MGSIQAPQGCWTCKKRKIGCDKALPSCNNCIRTNRECLGYGVRLVWPEKRDGRRKSPNLPSYTDPGTGGRHAFHYGEQFLNMSFRDVEHSRRALESLALCSNTDARLRLQPTVSLALHPELRGREHDLLDYYDKKISRMISTIDSNNGFRLQLLPMAVNGSSLAEKSLLRAILALSAFHLHGAGAALPFKLQALQLLSTSLYRESCDDGQRHTESQLAASMMLCVYNVFDAAEGNWHLHLNGSRSLLHQYAQSYGKKLDLSFLNTWFLYHEILGAFSQPRRHQYEGISSLDLFQESTFDKTVIIGSLGCSIEIMEIIHYINQLRAVATRRTAAPSPRALTALPSVMWTCQGLQDRLCRLQQYPPADLDLHTPRERDKILNTAELYRTAAVLYVRAVCPDVDATGQTPHFVDQAFALLRALDVCTSPWPLFVVACESRCDEHRITVLRALDRMDADRKIGNVFVLRGLIESYWKQVDLQADGERAGPLRWWESISFDTAAPWFI